MTSSEAEALKDAIRRLHRTKDAAYRDAWKKRGEVMSIMANIARKADRLASILAPVINLRHLPSEHLT